MAKGLFRSNDFVNRNQFINKKIISLKEIELPITKLDGDFGCSALDVFRLEKGLILILGIAAVVRFGAKLPIAPSFSTYAGTIALGLSPLLSSQILSSENKDISDEATFPSASSGLSIKIQTIGDSSSFKWIDNTNNDKTIYLNLGITNPSVRGLSRSVLATGRIDISYIVF